MSLLHLQQTAGNVQQNNLSCSKQQETCSKTTSPAANNQIPAAGSMTIASGTATGDITWKIDNVWNNDGDAANLYDGPGRLVSQKRR